MWLHIVLGYLIDQHVVKLIFYCVHILINVVMLMVLVGYGSQQKYYKRTRTEPSTGVVILRLLIENTNYK